MNYDPMVWTQFSSGKVMAVRESIAEKTERVQDKKLLAPWASALAVQQLQRDLLNMRVAGEA